MKSLKEYETRINVAPQNMCDGSMKDKDLIVLLTDMFAGKCMDASFITSVHSIKKRSMKTVDKSDLAGGGAIHVRFCARAITHPTGSVLVGCEVMNIERDGMITCRYDHAIVHIKGNRNFSPSKGDLVIAQVLETGYPVDSTNMSIGARPFSIPLKAHLKLVKPAVLGEVEVELLSRKLVELEEIKKQYEDVDKPIAKFFEDMFYPMKNHELYYTMNVNNKKGVVLKTSYESYDIEKLVEAAISQSAPFKLDVPIALMRHAAVPKQLPHVLVLNIDKVRGMKTIKDPMVDSTKFNTRVIAAPFAASLLEMLADYCDYMNLIVRCCSVYNTEAIRKSNSKLWSVYNQIKLS